MVQLTGKENKRSGVTEEGEGVDKAELWDCREETLLHFLPCLAPRLRKICMFATIRRPFNGKQRPPTNESFPHNLIITAADGSGVEKREINWRSV